MDQGDLTDTSLSSILMDNNPLFPRMRTQKHEDKLQDAQSTNSAENFGNMFKKQFRDSRGQDLSERPQNLRHLSQFDSEETQIYDKGDSSVIIDEDDNDFGGNEMDLSLFPGSSPSTDQVSLDSSILRNVNDQLQGENTEEPLKDPGNRKFTFLNMYENIARKRQEDNASVFGLTSLDDFSRFVKKSELNDCIQQQLRQQQIAQENNLLSIVETKDLARNFYTDEDNDGSPSKLKENCKVWFPWLGERGQPVQNKTEFDELRIAGLSLDSTVSSEKQTNFLQRKLKVRHLQMISFGGTLGVGLYLNSGKAFTIAGGLGTVLAFIICGIIVLSTIISFCEMVTFVSVVDGVSGLSARFVDESFGFTTGWLYFLSFSVGLAGEIVASVIILSYFADAKIQSSSGAVVGYVALFLSFCIVSNLIDVRVFGEVEYVSSLIKLIVTLIMIIVMIVINQGVLGKDNTVLGFKYWDYLKSDFDHNLIFGLFRPSFDLDSDGMDSGTKGITGSMGRFLSVLTATLIVSYAYSGTEIVCIAACEAKDPRKALPSATKRVFWRILIFYCLASFVVSLNIYAGDPRLLRYFSGRTGVSPDTFDTNYAIAYVGGNNCHAKSTVVGGFGNGSQSPWSVAFQSASLCEWSSVANAFLVFFALSCGNSQLYVSSRTIYSLALQQKAPAFLKKCNRFGIPYNAVLISSLAGFSSFICVSQSATVVFQNLTSIISASGVFVWFSMCLSFIRFYFGLKKRPDIISRDDKSYPYRSPFQPYSAIVGLIGSGIILLCMGFVVFLDGHWDTMFFFSSYGTLILVAVLYVGHKTTKGTRMMSLEALDFDSGRREMDIYIWDGGKEFNNRSFKDLAYRFVDFLS